MTSLLDHQNLLFFKKGFSIKLLELTMQMQGLNHQEV